MSITIKIQYTQAVEYYGEYYPKANDKLTIDTSTNPAKVTVGAGFDKLGSLNGASAVKVSENIYMTDWLSVAPDLDVQVVINADPHSLIFVWRESGVVKSSGISTGG